MSEVQGARNYRALVHRAGGPRARLLLHLIRDDAESSLCGIPRSSLTAGGILNDLVCADCIEWLPKRVDFSAQHPKVEPG